MGNLILEIEDKDRDTLTVEMVDLRDGRRVAVFKGEADPSVVHVEKNDLIKLRDFINVELKKLGEDQIVINQCMCRPYNSLSEAELDNNKCTQCNKPIKPQG